MSKLFVSQSLEVNMTASITFLGSCLLILLSGVVCRRLDNCNTTQEGCTNECQVKRGRYRGPPSFEISGVPLSDDVVISAFLAKNVTQQCSSRVNVQELFVTPVSNSVGIFSVYIKCISPAWLSFYRPNNFSRSDVILFVYVIGPCHMSAADLAVWGRAADLRVLYLMNGVSIEEVGLSKGDLEGLFNVGTLVLMNLKNKKIPRMFQTYVWKMMAEVQVSKMSLTSVPDRWKTTMPYLQSLELDGNNMQQLTNFPWCKMSLSLPRNLTRTSLLNDHYSEGVTIDPRIYRRFLVIQSNPSLSNFQTAPGNLDKISLRFNSLKSISSKTFQKVSALKVVDLSHNQLSDIPEGLFSKTPQITHVNLANNKLRRLHRKMFNYIKQIRKLNCENNNIYLLQDGLFNDQKHLLEINFENNSLHVVQPSAFSPISLNEIKKVKLGRNNLRHVPLFGFYARKLEIFDMSNNEVSFTDFVNALDSINIVTFTYIHQESASSVEANFRFSTKKKGKKILDLSHNRMEKFDVTHFNRIRLEKLKFLLKVFTLNLRGNPLECDCKTRDLQLTLLNWTKHAGEEMTAKDFDSWICHSPHNSNTNGKKILDVPEQDFRCEINSLNCPAPCACFRSPTGVLTIVDCRRRNLTKVPKQLPYGMVALQLQHNKIENLTFSRNLENVSILHASNNQLKHVQFDVVPLKLRELYIDSNQLTTLPKDFQNLTLSKVNLQRNFLTCDCEIFWLKSWLKENARSVVGGSESVACSFGKNKVKPLIQVSDMHFVCKQAIDVGKDSFATNTTSVYAIASYAVAGFLLLLLISVGMLYWFRKELKILLYTRFNWHPFDRVDDSDPNKIYDAFVSFNQRDVVWVMENLRETLENANPPYKLCIHCRDFIPGALISENILESVKSSRRMIMVLSRNFIQSEWCMLEFRAAHRRVLEGRKNYLIILLFDDVDIENLDKELKLYLKTNTYINVHSKWFWQQLKYALPHQLKKEER